MVSIIPAKPPWIPQFLGISCWYPSHQTFVVSMAISELEVPTIYKAYVRPMQVNIPTKYGLIYSTSNLRSWNDHWLYAIKLLVKKAEVCPHRQDEQPDPDPLAPPKARRGWWRLGNNGFHQTWGVLPLNLLFKGVQNHQKKGFNSGSMDWTTW